jgi:alpha-tubulin suppressor-like RCC1 family protein
VNPVSSAEQKILQPGSRDWRTTGRLQVLEALSIVVVLLLTTGDVEGADREYGQLWGVGWGGKGQLGLGTSVGGLLSPGLIDIDSCVIAAAHESSFYITNPLVLEVMGNNSHGQLGDRTTTDRHLPVVVEPGVVAVSSGGRHTLYLMNWGVLMGVGYNEFGELGDAVPIKGTALTPVEIDTEVVAVAAGRNHSFYIKSGGALMGMGKNTFGQLGDGTTIDRHSPIEIDRGIAAVAAGDDHSLYLRYGATLLAMGRNHRGQLGDRTTTDRHTPKVIDTRVSLVSARGNHSLYLRPFGTLMGMGKNAYGQLGDGTTIDRPVPVEIDSGVVSFAAGEEHNLYIKSDGVLMAVGWNGTGQLGDGTTVDRVTPVAIDTDVYAVAAGAYHSLYLKRVVPDPLLGGSPLSGLVGWYESDWFGYYNTTFAPWLFHADHGWLYLYPGSVHYGMLVYDHAMGAWWTSRSPCYPYCPIFPDPPYYPGYPIIYAYDPPPDLRGTDLGSGFLTYQLGSFHPREFVIGRGSGQDTVYFQP